MRVLVEEEKVGVREVDGNGRWEKALEDEVKKSAQVLIDGGDVEVGEIDEGVDGVGVNSCACAFGCPLDGGTYIPWEVDWLVGVLGWQGWMA
jgi:hypothetical protein